MTLRTRLLLGLLATMVVFISGVLYTIASQRSHLLTQVDEQLETVPLQPGRPQGPGPAPRPEDEVEPPISDLYVARLDDAGSATVVIEGQLLGDRPLIEAFAAEAPTERSFMDVDGEAGTSRFRVLYVPPSDQSVAAVVALPLDDVDDTMAQLTLTFVLVGSAMTVALAAIAFWVDRLAVRPITEMTEAADAIADGERERRVDGYAVSTEAGRLSKALNVMLDERDESEDRLRHFVSDASHELRTPLTSFSGYLDLYASGGFRGPGQLDDAVRRMQAESARMALLVDELLLLAKLDEQQPLAPGHVELEQLLGDVAASAEAAHPERSVQVTVPIGLAIVADPLRIQQAVAAIVDNALTHTPSDASVRVHAQPVEGGVEIVVRDDGPGLGADEAERVFDRFYRGDPSRSRSAGGSGLGLAITKSIIGAHGGTVRVASTPGQGATFRIELPQT